MSDIYLAKSDLTGRVYAVRGKSKTDVTEFVTALIAEECNRNDRAVIDGFLSRVRERETFILATAGNQGLELIDCLDRAIDEVRAEMFGKEQSDASEQSETGENYES